MKENNDVCLYLVKMKREISNYPSWLMNISNFYRSWGRAVWDAEGTTSI